MMRLDPTVIDEAVEATGARNVDQLGWACLDKSGTTVRNYISGKTVPPVPVLAKLRQITGRTLDSMILVDDETAA